MHIPDGYLGPQTCLPLLGVMAGYWAVSLRRLKRTLRLRQAPLLALGAAFSFVIMMFNVPIPGGTTGHAVGAVLVAVLLGPWAAGVAVSLALIVQALLFGDGGVLAIGANCLTMGVVMPFAGWGVYRLVAGGRPSSSPRHWVGAAIGGYFGLCAAAVAAGILFGIQPMIACDASGRPLYCPFGLSVSVSVMAAEHFLVFGFVEAVVTALVVVYFQRTAPSMLESTEEGDAAGDRRLVPALAAGLGILVILSPIGLFLPEKFGAGAAWGEWGSAELKTEVAKVDGGEGFVPEGIVNAEESGWKAPMPDYALPGMEGASPPKLAIIYILSGIAGSTLLVIMLLIMSRFLRIREQ